MEAVRSLERNPEDALLQNLLRWGAWVAPSVKRPTLDFGSGHDLAVRPDLRRQHGACLGFSLSAPPSLSLSK